MHTIHYSSSRKEVWRWYWREWAKPRGFWLYHVFLGIFGGASAYAFGAISSKDFYQVPVTSLFIFLFSVVFFSLWPQIKFKHSARALSINKNGLETTLGNLSGTRAWTEIAEITDSGQEIIIKGKNKNAFIIPNRAFANDSERKEFFQSATTWHSAASA